MAIGERIKYFRNKKRMTQKQLGLLAGIDAKAADVRIAQYESAVRTPKADFTNVLANVFNVSPLALNVPDIDTYQGLMHTLFALEDTYGLTVEDADGKIILKVDEEKGKEAEELQAMLSSWAKIKNKLDSNEIDVDEYDKWRYNYPEFDETGDFHKIVSFEC